MRASFILSEIGIGLRRNLTMTVAVIVTTAVSLAFFGFGLLFNRQVEEMKDFWYDKVEVSVFLCGQDSDAPSCAAGEVSQAQRDQIQGDLQAMPEVSNVFYESKQQAYTRFKEQFKESAIADNVTADQMPESFRVKLKDPEEFPIVATAFAGRDGVEQVQDQKALLEKFFRVLNYLKAGAWGLALIMIVVAVLLISNTIRVAAFSRRRETGIMKLVGASSFSIQLPFLLEGRHRRADRGADGQRRDRAVPEPGGRARCAPRVPVHRLRRLAGLLVHRALDNPCRCGAGRHGEFPDLAQVPPGLGHAGSDNPGHRPGGGQRKRQKARFATRISSGVPIGKGKAGSPGTTVDLEEVPAACVSAPH